VSNPQPTRSLLTFVSQDILLVKTSMSSNGPNAECPTGRRRSCHDVVLAATLFVYTRHHHQSPDGVPRLLSLVEMRLLYRERVMCERKAKKDAQDAVVSRAACVSRALLADASRPALTGWDTP